MYSQLTEESVIYELAKLRGLTTAHIGLIASVGINKAYEIKKDIVKWLVEVKGIILYNTILIDTEYVFEYLNLDLNKYKGGN